MIENSFTLSVSLFCSFARKYLIMWQIYTYLHKDDKIRKVLVF